MADPCWQQVGCPQQTLAHGLLSKSGHHERGEVHDHTDLDGFDGLWLAPTSGGELVSIKARVRSILLCAGKSSVLAGGCCTETSLCPLGASCTAVRTTSSACRCHLTISCEHQDAFCAPCTDDAACHWQPTDNGIKGSCAGSTPCTGWCWRRHGHEECLACLLWG